MQRRGSGHDENTAPAGLMRAISLSAIDLNLLVVFDAILNEQSVSRAAERLNLTQSAVSHSLSRLRILMDDPLFVRTPRGMQPTAHSEAIASQVSGVLRDIRAILSPEGVFDPARSDQRFTIGMTDYLAYIVMPELARRLTAVAPHVRIVVMPTNARACVSQLESSEIDIYAGNFPPNPPNYVLSSMLYDEESVCVARRGHPAFERRLSPRGFQDYAHLHVSPFGAPGYVEQVLASHKASRRIALTVGEFLVAPAILEQSDLIAILPRRIAESMLKRYALVLQPPPFEFGESRIGLTWHQRFDKDPGLSWLRNEIAQACAA